MRSTGARREQILRENLEDTLRYAIHGDLRLSIDHFARYLDELGRSLDRAVNGAVGALEDYGSRTLHEAWRDHLAEQYQKIPNIGVEKTRKKLEETLKYFQKNSSGFISGPKHKEAAEEAIAFAESQAATLDEKSSKLLTIIKEVKEIEIQRRELNDTKRAIVQDYFQSYGT